MSTLLESTQALKARALEVHLTEAEINDLIGSNVDTLSRLAFVPSDEQVRALFTAAIRPNAGTLSSLKRLIFEAQTLVVSDVKAKVTKKDDQSVMSMASAERENRIREQKARLTGLRLKGEEEVAYACYDLVLALVERDTLTYLGPEKFFTRRHELLCKKPSKELAIDQMSVIVKEKHKEEVCSTATELELVNAFRRRALAFDIVKLVGYNTMNSYHAELIDHMQLPPPPGYAPVSLAQVLRADQAAFLLMSEKLPTLKRAGDGSSPLERAFETVLSHPSVSFHLLPLAKSPTETTKSRGSTPNVNKPAARSRSPPPSRPAKSGGKGGKGKRKKGRGPNVPQALIGKALQSKDGKRLCWAFNLPNGCPDASPGGSCQRGSHLCAEPGASKLTNEPRAWKRAAPTNFPNFVQRCVVSVSIIFFA